LKASQDFFNGKHFNSTATGEGLGSYLDYLKTIRNGEQLSNKQTVYYYFTATAALNASFSTQVTTDNAKMILAYDALQQNVIYTVRHDASVKHYY
jgi:hypothetical protein